MAPDAVIGLIERTREVGAAVGEGEAVALAQVLEAVLRVALRRIRVHGHQAHEIQLGRRLEQYARAMLGLAFGRGDGPGRVTRGCVELARVGAFVFLPLGNVFGELQLRRKSKGNRIKTL